MGYETKCPVWVDDGSGAVRQADAATVLLESNELIVRGDARIKLPRSEITSVTSRGGVVTVKSPTATVALTVGPASAPKWKTKLAEPPKRLVDKLDVKPGAKVWLWGISDETLMSQIAERTEHVSSGRTASKCDMGFVEVRSIAELGRIDRVAKAIVDRGAIWVVHPKGPQGVADTAIFARAKALGLAYTKVASVSETLTAEKLVWKRDTSRSVMRRGTPESPQ